MKNYKYFNASLHQKVYNECHERQCKFIELLRVNRTQIGLPSNVVIQIQWHIWRQHTLEDISDISSTLQSYILYPRTIS